MTNILITGITGFIGAHLAERLSEDKNNNIYGLFRSVKNESTFNALKLDERKNINLLLGDISNYSNFENILVQYDIDNVYHLASQAIVKNAAKAPLATYSTNIFGTICLLEAVRNVSSHYNKYLPTFIMSSDKAYGSHNELPYKEDMSFNIDDVYSSSKSCEDIISRTYAKNYNLPIVVGRPCNAYGIDFNWTRLIPTLSKSCIKNEQLILNKGSYGYIREYIYVKDLVRAINLLIENIDKTKYNAYNISSGCMISTKDIVEKFLELSNCEKELKFKEREKTFREIETQFLDTTKLRTAIKWSPEYSLEEGLKETIEKYKGWFDSQ
jgi:CDP-glucose 4,6-dehydratase